MSDSEEFNPNVSTISASRNALKQMRRIKDMLGEKPIGKRKKGGIRFYTQYEIINMALDLLEEKLIKKGGENEG